MFLRKTDFEISNNFLITTFDTPQEAQTSRHRPSVAHPPELLSTHYRYPRLNRLFHEAQW
jgi:hypothetical protein